MVNKVYEVIIEKYGYDEPIFTKELKKQISISDVTLRQNLKRLSEKGSLIKVKNGIFYVPRASGVLKRPRVNMEKVITRKYIKPIDGNIIGYISGTNFANQLGLTTQTASVTTIVTNEVGRPENEVLFGKKVVKLKKPKTTITDRNFKVLQVLDLLNDYDDLSEIPIANSINLMKNYLMDVELTQLELNEYIKKYPKKTLVKILETGIYNEFAQK